MFEKYKQYQTSEFAKIPIISKIKNEAEWTVSSDKKIPVDMKFFLDNRGSIRPANVLSDIYPLVPLDDTMIPELDGINRTYHLHAAQNHIFMVDIEPKASDELLNSGIKFPANYTEISKNGGVHLLIEVPNDLINKENEYLFNGTVFKTPSGEFEYIFNNHFITFTKRIVYDKPLADFENNPNEKMQLKQLLNSIVEMDKDRKAAREAAQLEKATYNPNDIHESLIKRLLKTSVLKQTIVNQKRKDPNDVDNDMSVFEHKIAIACAGRVDYVLSYFKTMPQSRIIYADFSESDAIRTIELMLIEILDHREKHDEVRYGMPWLVYQASDSLSYVKAQKKLKKLEKQNKNK